MLNPSRVKNLPYFLLLTLLAGTYAAAQELPRPSMARHDDNNSLPTSYNVKAGPVLFDFTGSVDTEWNDNIGLNHNNQQSDFITTPEVGISMLWPVTDTNTLTLSTSLGYTHYWDHSYLDSASVLVAPNSALTFNVFVGDFKINFHDDFSYQQDPVNEGAFSNVATFDRFNNDAGVTVIWDLNQAILTLGYDHITFIATGIEDVNGRNYSDVDLLNFSADQLSASAEFHVTSTLAGGVEATASRRNYDYFSGDYTQLTAGPYVNFQVTQYIRASASAGYELVRTPDNTLPAGSVVPANVFTPGSGFSQGQTNNWYADLTLDHQVNQYFIHHLSLGHEVQIGLLGDQEEAYYADYTASWKVNQYLNLAFTLSYQDVDEQAALVNVSNYSLFEAGLQASFPITKSLSGAFIYQFNDKFADDSTQEYEQNEFGLNLTYQF
jgi:hypothetical protein